MPHDYKTRTIDYLEEQPPEWATPQEKINFYPKAVAHLVCEAYRQAEKKTAEGSNASK